MADALDRAQLAGALARLGVEASPDDARLLSGPYSGTRTYLVRQDGGDVVLKLVADDAPKEGRARGIREARFFAELARRVPLRLPRLIAASDDPIALLFAAYPPAPPAPAWQLETYVRLATDLAGLHGSFWDGEATLSGLDWLKPSEPVDSEEGITTARKQWTETARQPHLADLLSSAVMSTVERLLAAIPEIEAVRCSLPRCLCHGDCHAENILLDPEAPGALVWADWQEVGPGRGPEELSFFVQRAMTDGAELPEAELLSAYHRRLSDLVGPVTLVEIRQVADASELRTRLLQWPHYLAHLPSAATALSIQRMSVAAARLGI